MSNVNGKVIILTGGGQGIGYSITQHLAQGGATVVVMEYNADNIVKAEKELKELIPDASVFFVQGDVSNREDIQRVVDYTMENFKRIDGVINNAQAAVQGIPLEAETDEQVMVAVKTGSLGTMYMMQAVFPHMKEQGFGSIVNVTSSSAITGVGMTMGYGLSKGGIIALTRGAAKEWGQYGIRVNAYGPLARTPMADMFAKVEPEKYAALVAGVPLKRLGDPLTDIAPAVGFLVSDDSKFITGQVLMVDGGQLIGPA